VLETSGNIIHGTVVELLMGTDRRLTDSEAQPVVIHSPIDRRLPANNSLDRTATSVALTVGR